MKLIVEKITKMDRGFLRQWRLFWRNTKYSHLFNSPEWFVACLKTFKNRSFTIFISRNQKTGEIQTIVPLVSGSFLGFECLKSPGERFLDKSSILSNGKFEPFARILLEVKKEYPFLISEVSQDLISKLSETKILNSSFIESCLSFYLPLETEPFRFLSKKQKSKIKNKFLRFRRKIRFLRITGSRALQYLSVAGKVERKSTKKDLGIKVLDDKLFINLVKNLVALGKKIDLSLIYYDKEPFVFSIGFIDKKVYYALQTSFDKKYAHLSPGKLLLYFLLPELKRKGVKIFDFSRGENQLKKEFTKFRTQQFNIFYHPNPLINNSWKIALLARKTISSNRKFYEFIKKNIKKV